MKPFAIYFPQFYPTETNDRAWGRGFTDWTLVANANLRNSWQRRAPARGFYDGSSPAIHQAQMVEARAAGLGGFGVYHYWFYTHQELPAFEQTLTQGDGGAAKFPWFLIWASEGWSKRWIGDATSLVELASSPTAADIERHCDYLATCFGQPEYWRWQGRPLFVWYHLGHFDHPGHIVNNYREALAKRGFDVAMAHFIKNPSDVLYAKLTDASYLFEPRLFFGSRTSARGARSRQAMDLFSRLFGSLNARRLSILMDRIQRSGTSYSADEFVTWMASAERRALLAGLGTPHQEVISPGWDNTPRYGRRYTRLECLSPAAFAALLRNVTAGSEIPALVNAWNEWSEGAAIEPCAYLGRQYLDVLERGG